MATEEDDIELDENEIAVTRLALICLAGLLGDVREEDPEEISDWEDSIKEQVGLDEDCNLEELIMSALRKFREEDMGHEEQNQENEAGQD